MPPLLSCMYSVFQRKIGLPCIISYMTTNSDSSGIAWSEINAALHNLVKADGGFSSAHRGIVTLPGGQQLFVKVGVDDSTRKWARKEVVAYRFLKRHNYPFIPALLSTNEDETSFALEPLNLSDGWDWSETWTKARLDKTLEAMDALAAIIPSDEDKTLFEEKTIDETDDGWQQFVEDADRQTILLSKLRAAGHAEIVDALDFTAMAERSARYVFTNDALVHNDVRADNCPWDEHTGTIKLVDWNWLQLGDRRIDLAAMLTHIQNAGLNLLPDYASRLDSDALHWMAGFWFNSATKPIWPGGPEHLRERQLEAGVTALKLARERGNK